MFIVRKIKVFDSSGGYMKKETEIKWARIKELLSEKNLEGIIINKISNFAWFTGGGNNFVALNTENGVCSLLLTENKIYLLTDNIEAGRIKQEEITDIPVDDIIWPWYKNNNLYDNVRKIIRGNVASDKPDGQFETVDIEKLHFPLIDIEIERFKNLGRKTTKIISGICNEINPGITEVEVAGKLSSSLWANGCIPVVILIASDERITNYRHPIPTSKKIDKYAMIAVCAYEKGLILSMTRIVSFIKPSDEIIRKHLAVCNVDAAFIANTKPGNTVGDVFNKGIKTYEETGFADEWKKHHQGGPCGYKTRYYRATEKNNEIITPNQAFAWNPSITGTKSEDTIITTENAPLIISEDPKWPKQNIRYAGISIARPDILVR